MQIFQNLAGYSLGQADLVRRAMSKKKRAELMAQRDKFIYGDIDKGGNITGCQAHGIPPEVSAELFAQMESFASYAFNKSHAAAYAVVAYQTAYLKKYYPKEFLAGVLNNRITKIEEISKYVVYMKENSIAVYPPDVNLSKAYFSVQGDGLRFGLCALRGVGVGAMELVIEEREKNGPFKDFSDFILRCTKFVNKRMVEALIMGGAFDGFGYHRSQYCAVYEDLMRRVQGIDKSKASAQMSLFGDIIEEEAPKAEYPNIPEWEKEELLAKEKEVLGVYVSGHPFEAYAHLFKDCSFHCGLLSDYEEDEETGDKTYTQVQAGLQVTMGGIIGAIKTINTRKGDTMAFITVEDYYGSIECLAFARVYQRIKGSLRRDAVVRLSGKLDLPAEKAPVIILDKLEEVSVEAAPSPAVVHSEGPSEKTEQTLWLDARSLSKEDFEELLETLTSYEGEVRTKLLYGGKRYEFFVRLNRAFMAEVMLFLPESCVKLL